MIEDQNWCKILSYDGYTFLFFKGLLKEGFNEEHKDKPCVYCQHRVAGVSYISHFTSETEYDRDRFYEEDIDNQLMKGILLHSVTETDIPNFNPDE